MSQNRSTLKRLAVAFAATLMAALAFGWSAQASEVTLRAVTALPRQHDLSQSFLSLYVAKVNEVGKGIVHIQYVGGPEVTPPKKAVLALKRGVFDMLHSPTAYYGGIAPQGLTLIASNKTPQEVRADGGFDMISKVWKEKLNAKIVAWGEWGAQFYLYTDRKPPVKDGHVDMSGFKMRSTGAYRPLLTALGANIVSMPVGDVYTALQRGVVDGFGWPSVGLGSMGLAKAVKYRIDPPFYHLANLVLINYDKWNSLPQAAKDVLQKVGAQYEQASIDRMHQDGKADEATVVKDGVQIYTLTGKARTAYLNAAYDSMWAYIGKRLSKEELETLRSKMYKAEQ
ncbi:MAG TPA: TRAP transporter substrate-binding protein DctP [bacterium]|nr:TRAP transporter substrate-binding protein DctP [bacterium]